MNSCVKNGGAPRRRFPAICEKPEGGVQTPPRPGAGWLSLHRSGPRQKNFDGGGGQTRVASLASYQLTTCYCALKITKLGVPSNSPLPPTHFKPKVTSTKKSTFERTKRCGLVLAKSANNGQRKTLGTTVCLSPSRVEWWVYILFGKCQNQGRP